MIIKSLLFSNNTTAKLGNLQTQPLSSIVMKVEAPIRPPPSQTPVDIKTIIQTKDTAIIQDRKSVLDIANLLVKDQKFVIPPYNAKVNTILPSFALNLEPVEFARQFITDKLVTTSRKFEPYELLTGISGERPEIVMLTNFLPLFENDVSNSQPSFINAIENGGVYPYMTDAGRYVDTHLQARNLRYVDSIQLIRSLYSNSSVLFSKLRARKSEFEQQIDALRDSANFLLELVRSLERLKAQLDVRDDIHNVDPESTINQYNSQFSKLHALSTSNSLIDNARKYLRSTYNIPDVLIELGYSKENIKSVFSSTKIWLQLLLEMKQVLLYHSDDFIDISSTTQQRDNNAIGITRSSTKRFALKQTLLNMPSIADLSALSVLEIPTTINKLNHAWGILYNDVQLKNNEAKIAALANILSKEFRYSFGMASDNVKKSLLDNYDYVVTPADNATVFDSIIGKFGNNITDFPITQTNSLTNIAQRQPAQNVAVLTFESKYVDGDTGTLTPGSSYYVDQVLRTDGTSFNTKNIEEAAELFEKTYKNFCVIVDGMNLFSTKTHDPYDKLHTQYSSILSSQVDFVKEILRNVIDSRTNEPYNNVSNDNIGSIFSYAAKDNKVKSALFLYTISKITRLNRGSSTFLRDAVAITQNKQLESLPSTDFLISNIIDSLESTVPHAFSSNSSDVNKILNSKVAQLSTTIDKETIKNSLKNGTVVTGFVDSLMQTVLTAFRNDHNAIVDEHTRFNGWLDTNVLMIAFDLIVNILAQFNNQNVVSSSFVNGTVVFNISKIKLNHEGSINSLLTKMEKEVVLTQKLIYSVLNTLSKLSGSFRNYVNYLKSPLTIKKLTEISNLINDQNMLQMLMSEQQIMLLASTVHDLIDRLTQPSNGLPGNADVDGDGDFDSDDELKILDDSAILPKLRNAIYGTFGTKEYATRRGFNKKILTVGIPLGFSRKLKQRFSINNLKKTTFVEKQSDIVNVVVYKVDLQNSDIVYKPKKFLFELSRFPVRNDKHFLSLPDHPTINDIVHAIPTRDFGQNQTISSEITYWANETDNVSKNVKIAFNDESYSFLTNSEKSQIIQNHVMSYMTEMYVKLLTGINLADYHFNIVDPVRPVDNELVQLITEHHISHIAKAVNNNPVGKGKAVSGVLFSSTSAKKTGMMKSNFALKQQPQYSNAGGVNNNISTVSQFSAIKQQATIKNKNEQESIGTIASNLDLLMNKDLPLTTHGLRIINNLSHVVSTMSDPLAVSKNIVCPKQFDRVFNVIVDPDDFEIDYEKTVQTEHGKMAFEQMLKLGEVIPENENYFFRNSRTDGNLGRQFPQGRQPYEHALFKFRTKDKNQSDLTFEKYFITIETYDEDGI